MSTIAIGDIHGHRDALADLAFFLNLQTFHQTADCVCVHEGLDPHVPTVDGRTRDAIICGHRDFPVLYEGRATIVYGHFNNAVLRADGWPEPRTIGIDTIAHGVLTAVRLPEGTMMQSRRFPAYPPS